VVERALILADGEEIRLEDLPGDLKPEVGAPSVTGEGSLPSLKQLEVLYIKNLLARFSGHRSRVAAALGISERSLYRKLSEYGLE
jgi:DNA-binding NtrC family response regulator